MNPQTYPYFVYANLPTWRIRLPSTSDGSGSKKIALGRVGKYPGQSWVSLLFTAGQK